MPIAPLKHRIRQFFDRRAMGGDTHSFGLKNTYVFASKQGLLFLALLAITFIAGVNYGNNLILGLFFYLVSVWLVCAFVAFMQLASLTVTVKHCELGQAGDILWATLEIHSRAKSSRQIIIGFDDDNDLPSDKQAIFDNHKKALIHTVGNEPIRLTLPIVAHKRGANALPRLQLSCHYPLGIIVAWSYARFASPAWAYPKPLAFDMTAHQPINAFDDNDHTATRLAGLSDFDRLDNYIQGENLARVSWGHAARGLGLLTKHFSDTVGQEQRLDYANMPAQTHEDKLSMLAYAVLSLKESGMPFALHLPSGQGGLGVGDEFVKDCLLRLAKEP